MKKVIALLLVAMLSICSVGFAESLDLASMSLEDLIALRKSVDAEIIARNGSVPSPIYRGMYVAGESIAPGMYTIKCPDDGQSISVGIFADKDTYAKAFEAQDESLASFQSFVNAGETVFLQLDEGAVLFLSGEGEIQPVSPAWAP